MSSKLKNLLTAVMRKRGFGVPPVTQILVSFRHSNGNGKLAQCCKDHTCRDDRLLLRFDGQYRLPPEEPDNED